MVRQACLSGRQACRRKANVLLQLKLQWYIQLDGEIPAGIKYPGSSGNQVFGGVFQPAEVILPGDIANIHYSKMETENGFLFSIGNISTQACIQEKISIGGCFCIIAGEEPVLFKSLISFHPCIKITE